MDEIINTENISLDYSNENDEYRLSLFDRNYHYTDEIYLTPIQLRDLIEYGKEIKITCEDENL